MRHFFGRVKKLPESIEVDVFEQRGRMPSCTGVAWPTEYTFLLEMKQDQCICPLSWNVQCNFTGDGKCSERGWPCTPRPHQPGLILPSRWNVRQKATVATLCTLWLGLLSRPLMRKSSKWAYKITLSLLYNCPHSRVVPNMWFTTMTTDQRPNSWT